VQTGTWQRTVESEVLVPTPIAGDFGHARSLDETYRWVRPRLRTVPITRVYDATPLDHLGVPVWAAVTPLARDLTVHAGKGLSAEASRLSAIMEAVERVCGESIEPERLLRTSFERAREDGAPFLDPESFDLPFETAYDPSAEISWVAAYDLLQRLEVWVPYDLAVSPAREGVCRGAETNGLASGNTYLEAIVHALYELIERDSAAHDEFCALYAEPGDAHATAPDSIDPQTLPVRPRELVEHIAARGVQVRLQRLRNRLDVPVYGALLIDDMFPGNEGRPTTFGGFGCDLDPARAVLRAVTEAAQSHTTVTVSARDAFEGTRPAPDRAARLQRNARVLHATSFVAFEDRSSSTGDLLPDLETLLRRLSSAGFEHCAVVDMARDDVGIPVVRVLVPGLSGPYGFSSRRPNLRLLMNLV
jgi:YcaO-like protein with predicted kinase domain